MENARTFTNRLADLLTRERAALGDFLAALADFDRQRLWLQLGYASLFDFLHRELGLSKGAAFYRKAAVELLRRFPEVVEPLRDGRLCLMSIVEVGRVLTHENRTEVLPRFFRLSKREAKALAAELLPVEAPPTRALVTPLRAPTAAPALALVAPHDGGAERRTAAAVQPVEPARPSAAPESCSSSESIPAEPAVPKRPANPGRPPTVVEPLTAELSRLHVTVPRRFIEKLEAARAALSHSHPGANMDEILEAGLDLVLERHAKRRGLVKKPRREPPPAKPDHVPAHVGRAVWQRDGGRCQWPLASGGICGATHQVEIDHVHPRARGGPATVENLRLLCRRHNDLAARQVYGDAWMDRVSCREATSTIHAPGAE